MHITDSARNHDVADADMLHAALLAIAYVAQGERELRIGPDRAGNLLEIVVADPDDDNARIIHAMRLRPSFYRYLPGR